MQEDDGLGAIPDGMAGPGTVCGDGLADGVGDEQRQLQAEGTTFQAVLTSTRQHLARHYLTHSAMTTAEIAYLLAYDDTNSFYRAFRTWTGTTPDTVRTTTTSATAAAP